MFAAIHCPGAEPSSLMDCAGAFSPVVEQTSADTATFDAGGLARLFRTPAELAEAIRRRASELGFEPDIAIAANPDAAVCATRGFQGIALFPALDPLPVDILDLPPETAETLERWGVRTCAQFAALPESGIAERLGPEGVHLRRLACGTATRPLKPAYPPPSYGDSIELEYPLTLLEPLAFLLGRLLAGICGKLESHGLATHELRLTLKLENRAEHTRTLRLPYPMRDTATFLKLLKLDLDAHPPKAPIVEVSLAAEPVDPRVVQHGLFVPIEPEPQKLELTLARISKIVGEGNAGSPELLDTHRPGAFRMKRFKVEPASAGISSSRRLALRVFRPPLKARIPSRDIVSSAGPWRTSGDWWQCEPWGRDEWEIALRDGTLYRVYKDHATGDWFIYGVYD